MPSSLSRNGSVALLLAVAPTGALAQAGGTPPDFTFAVVIHTGIGF